MKVKQWDVMMHFLLQEKKDKEKKSEDKKVSKVEKKSIKKAPKPKTKLKVKIKKTKLDEQIERVEKQLKEYGEERSPDWEEEDYDMDFDDAIDDDDEYGDDEELDDFDDITEPDHDDEEEFDFGGIKEELADAILESLKPAKKTK